MSSDKYWVGVRWDTGAMWLYDPSIQHDDQTIIYAYCVNSGEMREYEKKHVRKMLSTMKSPKYKRTQSTAMPSKRNSTPSLEQHVMKTLKSNEP